MSTWADVCRLAATLPDAVLGEAHEGSPAWSAGRHQFARLRWDDEARELLQLWSGDMDLPDQMKGRPEFARIDVFRFRVSVWALLERLDVREAAELMLDSYAIRSGPRRRQRVDEPAYFAACDR